MGWKIDGSTSDIYRRNDDVMRLASITSMPVAWRRVVRGSARWNLTGRYGEAAKEIGSGDSGDFSSRGDNSWTGSRTRETEGSAAHEARRECSHPRRIRRLPEQRDRDSYLERNPRYSGARIPPRDTRRAGFLIFSSLYLFLYSSCLWNTLPCVEGIERE